MRWYEWLNLLVQYHPSKIKFILLYEYDRYVLSNRLKRSFLGNNFSIIYPLNRFPSGVYGKEKTWTTFRSPWPQIFLFVLYPTWKPVYRLTFFELSTGAPGFLTGVSGFEWVELILINDNRLCDWIGHNLTATPVIGQMERAMCRRVLKAQWPL